MVSGEDTIIDFFSIFIIRLGKPRFLIDVLAAIPIELFLYLYHSEPSEKLIIQMQSNRLLKIIWLQELFAMLENSMRLKLIYCRGVQGFLYIIIIAYFFTAGWKLVTCLSINCGEFIQWRSWAVNLDLKKHLYLYNLYSVTDILTASSGRDYTIISVTELIFLLGLMVSIL